jgi:hypothetical protein
MRIKINSLLLFIIAVVLTSGSLYAQRGKVETYADPLSPSAKPTPLYIGACAGVNILGHSMDIESFAGDVLCPHFENASGLGFFGGLTMEYLFGDVATSSSALIVRAMYNMFPGSVTVTDHEYPIRNSATSEVVNSVTESVMDIDYNGITFEVMYKINPIPAWGLGIVVGPSVDYIITKNRSQKYNIVTPNNVAFDPSMFTQEGITFENNNRTAVMYDGEIENAGAIRFGVKAGVQYEILLGSNLYIVPAVSYNFGLTSVSSDYTWRVSPLQIALDARFAF